MFREVSFSEALENNLKIMDMTAFALCRENKIPVIVFNMDKPGNFLKVVSGEKTGTIVS